MQGKKYWIIGWKYKKVNDFVFRLLYILLMAGGSMLMAAMLTSDVQHNLQSAFKGMYFNFQLDLIYNKRLTLRSHEAKTLEKVFWLFESGLQLDGIRSARRGGVLVRGQNALFKIAMKQFKTLNDTWFWHLILTFDFDAWFWCLIWCLI